MLSRGAAFGFDLRASEEEEASVAQWDWWEHYHLGDQEFGRWACEGAELGRAWSYHTFFVADIAYGTSKPETQTMPMTCSG